MLERLDLLRRAVLEQFDLVEPEVFHDGAVAHGVHVHADVVGARAERRRRLRTERHGGERQEYSNNRSRHTPSTGRLAN